MQTETKCVVPVGTKDPIGYLIERGKTIPELAVAWGLKSSDAVYRLKRFENPPRPTTAVRMAETFGWNVGDVFNLWLARTGTK